MSSEVELKLRLSPDNISLLRRHQAIKRHLIGKPVTRRLLSIYYDTPDLKLLDAGISLRVRRMSGRWFQAVKSTGHSLAGLHQRMEWEDKIAKGQPDFTKINNHGISHYFNQDSLRNTLKPIFTTDVRRTEWLLDFQGSIVEMALDLGHLQASDQEEPICEIELELKQGQVVHLFELALALQAEIPAHIENVSKAQRGYVYYRMEPASAIKARAIPLRRKDSAAHAFRQAAWECMRQIQGNQDIVLSGADSEGLHQMRIGMRRLSAMFKLFRYQNYDIGSELKWIRTLMGKARDWDVLILQTLPGLLKSHPEHDTTKLVERMERSRKLAHTRLRHAISSQRYQRLLLSLGAYIEAPHNKNETQDLQKIATRRLKKAHAKLTSQNMPANLNIKKNLHAIRIMIKNLRYACETFSCLYSQKRAKSFIKHLMRLQDCLGNINDIHVLEMHLRQLAHSLKHSPIKDVVDQILHAGMEKNAACVNKALSAWQSFLISKPFWK